jgi:hypothetical protein
MDEVIRPEISKPKVSSDTVNIKQFDVIELPSKGLLYPDGNPKNLSVYYLTAKEEDILTSPNLMQSGLIFDELLKSAIKDCPFDPSKLLICDRNAILIWLRSTGYGKDYPARIKCKSCGHEHIWEFDLSTLPVKDLEVEPNSDGLFEYILPQSKKIVKFSLLIGEDENILNESMKTSVTTRHQRMIKSIDGNTSAFYIRDFSENMPANDSRSLKNYINSIEPGIIMEQEVKCPNCGKKYKEVLPIGLNFFYPDYEV